MGGRDKRGRAKMRKMWKGGRREGINGGESQGRRGMGRR